MQSKTNKITPFSSKISQIKVTQGGLIEECRDEFGVGSICSVLPIAPSSYDAQLAVRRDPSKASKRAQQDARDSREIRRVFSESGGRYGARKVWHALRREGYDIARLTRSHYTTQGWLRAAGWIQRDDSDQGNVRCQTEPLPPSREYCAPRLT